jgi:hypothetical protein
MKEIYTLQADGKLIGHTEFEYADPPMGVVYGKIIFDRIDSPYKFFKELCIKYNIEITTDYPRDNLISTRIIPQLIVYLPNGGELKGWGASVTGMDSDSFEVQFEGISSEIMKAEFACHYYGYFKAE